MEDCPQCRKSIKSPHARLVVEDCGHKKCRLCLIKDEDGCRQCAVTNKANALKKDHGGKKMPFHPPTVTRRGRKKKFPHVSEKNNNKSPLKTEDNNNEINHISPVDDKLCTKNGEKDVSEETKAEGDTDDSSDRRYDDSSNYEMKDQTIKSNEEDKTGKNNNFAETDEKMESADAEELEVKIVKKRKPLHIADHISITPGARPFKCELCDKAFKQRDKLIRHMKIHTGEKNYMCEDCGKSFGYKWSLVYHKRTHSRERLYQCQTCSRHFTSKKDLKRHSATHTGINKQIPQQGTSCTTSTTSKKRTRKSRSKKSTCITSTSKLKESESVKPYVELTVPPSVLKRVREEKNLKELSEEPEPVVKPSSTLKEIVNPVNNLNVRDYNDVINPFNTTNITTYNREILSTVQDMSVPRIMNPVQDINVSNYNCIRDTSIISFKEMLEPINTTDVFSGGSLFEQIPEAKQLKSQAVPVINSPIAPSNYSLLYEEPQRTNEISNYSDITYDRNINSTSVPSSYPIINYGGPPRYKEKIIIEGTNCVPTITKASTVYQPSVVRTNSAQQTVVTNFNTNNQRYYSCKKTGKILETDNLGSYIPTTTKILQSDLHWRKRTIELSQLEQEMAQNNDFI
ncbi:hypothetical protein C0J52_02364 [Blattella germanica]|nr:hypothetical protein C0J52_02364 [Blattella germanica]